MASLPFLFDFVPRFLDYLRSYDQQFRSGVPVNPMGIYTETGFIPFLLTVATIGLALSALYTVPLVHLRGGTPGKLLTGLRVRPWAEDRRPSWAQSWQRWLTGDPISALAGFWGLLDSLWPVWDDRRQALHDKWPGTVVVSTRR